MSDPYEIRFYNRYTDKIEVEKVYGHKAVEFAYNSMLGKSIAGLIASKSVSKLYGSLQDSPRSAKKVPKFIKDFEINIDEFERGSLQREDINHSYISFNEFFIRKFKKGKREFISAQEGLAACAEARYFGYDKVTDELKIPVKGSYLKALDLLENEKWGQIFEGGSLVVARLCPVDYHRYHYPDDGSTTNSYPVKGNLHSVNPIALKHRPNIFIKNERRVSILDSENFGKIAFVEVGATCVGKIVQSFDEKKSFKRGDEKGYFLFGGSTVILLGEPGRWSPCEDILKNTQQGLETYIKLGDVLGKK